MQCALAFYGSLRFEPLAFDSFEVVERALVIVACHVVVDVVAVARFLFVHLHAFCSAEFREVVNFPTCFDVEKTDVSFFDFQFLDAFRGKVVDDVSPIRVNRDLHLWCVFQVPVETQEAAVFLMALNVLIDDLVHVVEIAELEVSWQALGSHRWNKDEEHDRSNQK